MAIRFWDKGAAPGPEAMTLEHEEILAGLRRAMLQPGPIGKTAQRAMRLCLAHFPQEEKLMFPAFGLLSDLSVGKVRPEMAVVLPLIPNSPPGTSGCGVITRPLSRPWRHCSWQRMTGATAKSPISRTRSSFTKGSRTR